MRERVREVCMWVRERVSECVSDVGERESEKVCECVSERERVRDRVSE